MFLDPNSGDHSWVDGGGAAITAKYTPGTPEIIYSWSAAGDLNIIPNTDNTGNIGTGAKRWKLVRAVTVTTGDLNLESEDKTAAWTVKEEPDFIRLINRNTGKQYRIAMIEIK